MPATDSEVMPAPPARETRNLLAIIIVGASIVTVCILAVLVIVCSGCKDDGEAARYVLTAVLPLLGTWVGTVLAFYFAKESLETAARTTKELVGQATDLATVFCKDVLTEIGKIKPSERTDEPESLDLQALIDAMQASGRQRLPIFTTDDVVRYVLHLSTAAVFLSTRDAGAATTDITFGDLLKDPASTEAVSAIAWVSQEATLADAKQAMERIKGCQDVFVTQNGQKDEPVLGWITNNKITKLSKA